MSRKGDWKVRGVGVKGENQNPEYDNVLMQPRDKLQLHQET